MTLNLSFSIQPPFRSRSSSGVNRGSYDSHPAWDSSGAGCLVCQQIRFFAAIPRKMVKMVKARYLLKKDEFCVSMRTTPKLFTGRIFDYGLGLDYL